MTSVDRNIELVERANIDELVRHIDRLVAAEEWDALLDVRERSRRALERGKQLWPIASLAEYRLALDAPGAWAARVLTEDHGRFAPGPLAEVAASTHTWDEVGPHLRSGPVAVMFAHERVVRGEDLRGVDLPGPPVLDLPLRLADWEPSYARATYTAEGVDAPPPVLPDLGSVLPLPRHDAPTVADDPGTVRALRALARAWVEESNGRADAVAVEGSAFDAISALRPIEVRSVALGAADAVAAMAWTAASGGAHGRRAGAAAGRFEAWWAAAALCGFDDDATPPADELGEAISELSWWRWDAREPAAGWELRLAVEDPAEGLAWAVAATDYSLES